MYVDIDIEIQIFKNRYRFNIHCWKTLKYRCIFVCRDRSTHSNIHIFFEKIQKDVYVYVHMHRCMCILQCTKVASPNKKQHSSHLTNKTLGPRFGCIGTTLSGPMCANFQALIPAAVTTVNRDDGSIIFLGHGISVSGQIS